MNLSAHVILLKVCSIQTPRPRLCTKSMESSVHFQRISEHNVNFFSQSQIHVFLESSVHFQSIFNTISIISQSQIHVVAVTSLRLYEELICKTSYIHFG